MSKATERLAVPAEAALQIGEELDAWRRKQGMTQRELKQIAQVSQGQISRILAGKFSYADPPVLRLCAAAGINWSGRAPAIAKQALHRRLHAELDSCWDGSEAGAEALIGLLRAASRIGPGRPATRVGAAE
ncbi:helix-turn-helix domain-containing protein [[Pseudomonas] boreopolis]